MPTTCLFRVVSGLPASRGQARNRKDVLPSKSLTAARSWLCFCGAAWLLSARTLSFPFCQILLPSTLSLQESQPIARTIFPTRWLGPCSCPSESEQEGPWRSSDPRSSFHARGGSQRTCHHSAVLTISSPYIWDLQACNPQGWPSSLPASTPEAAPAAIPSLPPPLP